MIFLNSFIVSEPITTVKKITEIVQTLVQKYDEYYLACNDGPGTLITLVQLKDKNFDKWADAIELTLKSKNKLGFLDGIISQHNEDDVKYKRWKK